MEKYEIYTDGAARGNPGRGGFGAIILNNGEVIEELSQGYEKTTNNRMEIMAAIAGLQEINDRSEIVVYSDSGYLCNAVNKYWLEAWRKNNWKRKDGKLQNVDLWKQLYSLLKLHNVTFKKVKGHSGVKYNEECDKLATKAADGKDLIHDSGYFDEKIVDEDAMINNGDIARFSENTGDCCLICGDKNIAHLQDLRISRKVSLFPAFNFTICDDCIARMANDMVRYLR